MWVYVFKLFNQPDNYASLHGCDGTVCNQYTSTAIVQIEVYQDTFVMELPLVHLFSACNVMPPIGRVTQNAIVFGSTALL
jgi:hypothetical protein